MTTIRRFRREDALPVREVFVAAVMTGAAGRYTPEEQRDWIPDPAMPDDWADWLDANFTVVADEAGAITGFFTLKPEGYLHMAFVRPDRMGTGLADRLYRQVLDEARRQGQPRMTTIASRYAQGFFRRQGWRLAPEIVMLDGHDLREWDGPDPVARAMELAPLPAPDDRRDAR